MNLLLMAFCLSAISFAQTSLTDYPTSRYYTFSIDSVSYVPTPIQEKIYREPTLLGVSEKFMGQFGEVGDVDIPVIRFYVDGEGQIDIEPAEFEKRHLKSEISTLKPVIASASKHESKNSVFVGSARIADDSVFPSKHGYEIQIVGYRRGVLRRMVTLFPVQWTKDNTEWTIKKFRVRTPLSLDKVGSRRMALVVDPQFKNSTALQKLVKYEKRKGFTVVILWAEGKLTTSDGIRSALQELYREPHASLGNAILVGDHPAVVSYSGGEPKPVTDHYYRALDEYAADINTPDIGLGRFSARSESELDIMVERTIKYESPFPILEKWRRRTTWIATDDPDYYMVSERTHEAVLSKWFSSLSFQVERLYALTGKATDQQVHDALGQGRGLVVYAGHGLEDHWEKPHVTIDDLKVLEQNVAIPVVFSHACDTAKFSFPNSFAEAWQRHSHGSVFFWGSIDATYWDEDEIIEKAWADSLFRFRKHAASEITDYALSEVWRYYGGKEKSRYFWETYALFSDPTLSLRMGRLD